MRRRYSNFRRFGHRYFFRTRSRRYRRYGKGRRYPLYRSMRSVTGKSIIRMSSTFDFNVYSLPVNGSTSRFYQVVDWRWLNLSVDFNHYNELYSTFIPLYIKVRWVPNIQSNASGYYLPGGAEPITYNLTDCFSTTRYDISDNPIDPTSGVQYSSFKTFNPARNWSTIVYPRRNQMTAPRQQFLNYEGIVPISDNLRGMGRLWIQGDVSWEDTANGIDSIYPNAITQSSRMTQLGHLYAHYYMRVFDRK